MHLPDDFSGKEPQIMANLTYILYISIGIPLVMMLGMLRGKSRRLVLFMIIGVTICLLASEVNPITAALVSDDELYITTTITPITEELLKALPILFYACTFSDSRQDVLEISMAVGIGFALLENAWILVNFIDSMTIALALIRGFGSALMHGVCCLFVGCGISYVKKRRKLFYTGIFAMLSAAVIYHASYNSLVQSAHPYTGIMLPVLTYIPILLSAAKSKPSRGPASAGKAGATSKRKSA